MTQPRRVLGIMAKAPIAGEAKTRLIPHLGAEQAASLYRHMLLDSINLVAEALAGEGTLSIVCPSAEHRALLAQLVPASVELIAHERGALMNGLSYGLNHYTARGSAQVVLFNGDSPTMPPAHLRAAFAALDDADVVLGPTLDGGYYLIGAKAPQPDLFQWDQVDSATIFWQTRERAEARGALLAVLEPWYDVDTAEDFARLLDELRSHPHGAGHTRAFLGERGYL